MCGVAVADGWSPARKANLSFYMVETKAHHRAEHSISAGWADYGSLAPAAGRCIAGGSLGTRERIQQASLLPRLNIMRDQRYSEVNEAESGVCVAGTAVTFLLIGLG